MRSIERAPGHYLLDRGSACERLLRRLTDHAQRVGLQARLREAFLAIARYRDVRRKPRGFGAIAGAVALEAAYEIVDRQMLVPPREVFFEVDLLLSQELPHED